MAGTSTVHSTDEVMMSKLDLRPSLLLYGQEVCFEHRTEACSKSGPLRARARVLYALHAANHGMADPRHAAGSTCAGGVSAGGFGRGASLPDGAVDLALRSWSECQKSEVGR